MRLSTVVPVLGLVVVCSAESAQAQVPDATIVGPVHAMPPGDPSRNAIYNASAIPLEAAGYVEEEYFIEGTANRYATAELETGTIVDEGHPYQSRFIVRRPPAAHFNGVVMVEWLNVTGGPDKDIDWWLSGHHFVREGYAFIAVSAQQVGIDTLKGWSPERYGVPFRDVLNAAYEHLVRWVEDGTEPPTAPRLRVARLLPQLELARDGNGNVLAGIRLAAHAVPTARNTGMNRPADGGSRFCGLYGSHEPFDGVTLRKLYPTRADYMEAVREVVGQNLAAGYILPYAAARTIRAAEEAKIGR